MIKDKLKEYKEEFKKSINDLKHRNTIYKQVPNLITIARPLGMIPANILFFTGNVVPAVILTGLLLTTDLIDGKLARKWNVQSKLGADLDAVGDKVMFVGMSLPILLTNPLMILNVVLEVAISYVNVLGRIKGLDTKTVYSGKIKTWFLSTTLLMGYLVKFFGMTNTIFNTLVSLTCIAQGVALNDYVKKYKHMESQEINEIKTQEKEENEAEQVSKVEENLIEQLKKEKEFFLSNKEPDKIHKHKKRTRKKNNN